MPSSTSMATTSSTNSGLPSATSRMRAAARPPSRAVPSRWRSRSAASASASGSSRTEAAFGRPRPTRAGRRAARDAPSTSSSSGASRAQSATCSRRSTNVGSAQCRSSTTSTSGASLREGLEHPAHRPERLLGRDRLARAARAARPARAMAGSASAATCSNRPLSPSASTSGHQVEPVAVGQAAARGDRRGAAQRIGHLGDEARLADAGGAEDGEELAGAIGDGLVERVEQLGGARAPRPTIGARWRCGSPAWHRAPRATAGRPRAPRPCP